MIADSIAQWPNVAIVLSFAGLLLVLLAVAQRLGRLLPRDDGQEARAIAALDTFKVLGPLAGVFLSFLLVQAIGQFRAADVNVSREAADIYQLDRALSGAASVTDARPARIALRAYLRSVVGTEWPAMQHGVDSPETAQALARLQQAADAMMESLPSEVRFANDIDKNLDDVQDDRATRLGIAHGGLPPIMWAVLAALLTLLFACAAFLQGAAARHPLPILYIAGLGLLSALLFIMDRPFQGELSVSPAPLVKVQNQLDARLR